MWFLVHRSHSQQHMTRRPLHSTVFAGRPSHCQEERQLKWPNPRAYRSHRKWPNGRASHVCIPICLCTQPYAGPSEFYQAERTIAVARHKDEPYEHHSALDSYCISLLGSSWSTDGAHVCYLLPLSRVLTAAKWHAHNLFFFAMSDVGDGMARS